MASVMIPPQVLLNIPVTFNEQVTTGKGLYVEGVGTGYCNILLPNNGSISSNGSNPNSMGPAGDVWNFGYVFLSEKNIIVGEDPAQSTLTVTSGTVYQNTTQRYLSIDVAVYASTAGTAGTMAFAKGASSTPSTIWTRMVNSATTSTSTDVQPIRIPPGFYWSLTLSGATFGTITQVEE